MKRYTNKPAGAGRHAARLHTESPIVRERLAEAGVLICKRCGAEHIEKHWYAPDARRKGVDRTDAEMTMCPGCERVEKQVWNGEVVLEGPQLDAIRETLRSLITRVADDCWHDNPTAKICSISEEGGKLNIKTTTVWLASRLGKEIKKAYHGELEIKQSPDKAMVYVHWTSRN